MAYELQSTVNPDDKTALEKKHVPFIQAPETVKADEVFEIKLTMGKEIDHPMEDKHYIQYVALHADYYQLARVDFTPECKAEATLNVKLKESCTLRAYVFCNIHGQWEAEKEITVE